MNDLSLYYDAQKGDIKAFETLFRRFYAPLCRYAYRFTGDPDFSEELVQELFYVLWRDRASIHIERSVKSYLYEAVRNRALHFLAHLRVRALYSTHVKQEGAQTSSPEERLYAIELEKRIDEILHTFPDRRRTIFCMNRFDGKKYTEIAKILSVSIKTVEAEMHKALIALREGLIYERTT